MNKTPGSFGFAVVFLLIFGFIYAVYSLLTGSPSQTETKINITSDGLTDCLLAAESRYQRKISVPAPSKIVGTPDYMPTPQSPELAASQQLSVERGNCYRLYK